MALKLIEMISNDKETEWRMIHSTNLNCCFKGLKEIIKTSRSKSNSSLFELIYIDCERNEQIEIAFEKNFLIQITNRVAKWKNQKQKKIVTALVARYTFAVPP